jgi:hypothetical protein
VAGVDEEEDEACVVSVVLFGAAEADADAGDSSAMAARYAGGGLDEVREAVLWIAHVVMLAGRCAGSSKRLFADER